MTLVGPFITWKDHCTEAESVYDVQVAHTRHRLRNYCPSNAMHGQNINLPMCVSLCVCVSICVSVTPFVNSPTGQTAQRIFTVDSLADADLRKDVPFGGLDDE